MVDIENDSAKKLAEAHWDYVGSVLDAHGVEGNVIRIARHHYVTGFVHGHKHAEESLASNGATKAASKFPVEFQGWTVFNRRGILWMFNKVGDRLLVCCVGEHWSEEAALSAIQWIREKMVEGTCK